MFPPSPSHPSLQKLLAVDPTYSLYGIHRWFAQTSSLTNSLDKQTQVCQWLLLISNSKNQPVRVRDKCHSYCMVIVLSKAKLCQLTANNHPSLAEKVDTLHECSCGSEKVNNESTEPKWRSKALLSFFFVQIVSMIKPFSLQLDSLWRHYGLRK